MKKYIIYLLFTLLLVGCSGTNPMNLSDEEWERLPSDQKIELREKQYKIDANLRLEREKNRATERKLALKKEIIEQQRLNKIVEHAQIGDIININIYSGYIQNKKHTYQLMPRTFTLTRGEGRYIELSFDSHRFSTTKRVYVEYDNLGNKVTFYPNSPNYTRGAVVLLNDGSWYKEKRYRKIFDRYSHDRVDSMSIGIRYIK
jgi:hypothetical protein